MNSVSQECCLHLIIPERKQFYRKIQLENSVSKETMCHEDGEMNMWISKKERARDNCNCELLKVITIKNKMKDAHLRLFRHIQ